jgi:hypothetical protein
MNHSLVDETTFVLFGSSPSVDCMTAAAELQTGEHARVVALLARAPAIGLSGPQTDMLVNALRKTTDVGKTLTARSKRRG